MSDVAALRSEDCPELSVARETNRKLNRENQRLQHEISSLKAVAKEYMELTHSERDKLFLRIYAELQASKGRPAMLKWVADHLPPVAANHPEAPSK